MQPDKVATFSARRLVESYSGRNVLDSLTLDVEAGSIVGLLGANGSGKTTLLRVLLGLLPSDSGSSAIAGHSSLDLPDETRGRIGYVPQAPDQFGWLTGRAMLRYVGAFYPGFDSDYAFGLAARFQLSLATAIQALSPGQRQRLAIVRALATRPDYLVLDEPMAALDPGARLSVIEELVVEHRSRGTTMLVSSHIVTDLERYCTHLAIIENGRVAGFDSIARFASLARVQIVGSDAALAALPIPPTWRVRSSPGERIVVLPREAAEALRVELPAGIELRALPDDLEAVLSEWMR
jgi:ABC-2 type transport system ATP-binding protein